MTTSPFDADRGPDVVRRRRGGGSRKPDGALRKRRSDPNAVVPDPEFSSYYGRQIVKPAPWKHEVPAYLFLGGVTAGSGLIGAFAHARGLDTLRRNSRYSAVVGVGLSSGALIADLGRPERFLNMLRTVKLTSPMSVGTWILAAFGASAGVAVASEIAGQLGIGQGDSKLQRTLGMALDVADPLSSLGSAAFAAPLAAYTAVLLSDTATPMWHEAYRELPYVFTGSALAASSGLALLTSPTSQTAEVRRLAAFGALVELTAHKLMTRRLGELAEPLEQGRAGRLSKAATALTIAGGLGAAVLGRNRVGAAVSGLALLAGSAATRFSIVEAGIESAKDPKYTVRSQKARLAARRAKERLDHSITTALGRPGQGQRRRLT
ncbi:NrfD/PsrC family molybdoenzyme membrane anchor subunit [Blastococcus sp. Marseille-P5729]|uniref:NrfD/PsrC family molybdoenzyme membrane anchor subunit n=1 Tax=Blastococcus sp. Marseille-P5729 TaxID=2086582 RepID=UPI000D0F1B5A|nr:NrfD/PsrC family molybdoenzyme membrane anchor subunit [Blastococcus sp. Marseille-P5729]